MFQLTNLPDTVGLIFLVKCKCCHLSAGEDGRQPLTGAWSHSSMDPKYTAAAPAPAPASRNLGELVQGRGSSPVHLQVSGVEVTDQRGDCSCLE